MMNCREGQKAPRGTGKAKRVFTQSQWDCGTEKELSETALVTSRVTIYELLKRRTPQPACLGPTAEGGGGGRGSAR